MRVCITLSIVLQIGLNVLGVVIMISIVNYWMLLPIVVVGGISYFLKVVYTSTSMSVKRMEGIGKHLLLFCFTKIAILFLLQPRAQYLLI